LTNSRNPAMEEMDSGPQSSPRIAEAWASTWQCASIRPGTNVIPWQSMVLARLPACADVWERLPTAAMKPPRTATALAAGLSGSIVKTRALTNRRSCI
jgi:hypothetical protein